MAILSQRAYARHRGMALSAVQKAISSERISTLPDGRIDSDVADGEWAANTNARQPTARRQDDDQDVFGAAQYARFRTLARSRKWFGSELVLNLVVGALSVRKCGMHSDGGR